MNLKKIVFAVGFLAIEIFLLNFNAPNAKAMTSSEILALIQQLQDQIAALQKQLVDIDAPEKAWCHNFNTNLRIGESSSEVMALQVSLEKDGFDVGMEADPETVADQTMGRRYFGERTASAVVGFQEKYKTEVLKRWGLVHGTGYVGPSTRVKLNQLYGCGIASSVPDSVPTPTIPTPIIPETVQSIPTATESQKTISESVQLQSAVIDSGALKITYSKDFATCVHLLNSAGNLTHKQNYFCREGTSIAVSQLLSGFSNIEAGSSVRLCHGNNYGICSEYVSIVSSTTTTTTTTTTTNTAPSINIGAASLPTAVLTTGEKTILRFTLITVGSAEDISLSQLLFTVKKKESGGGTARLARPDINDIGILRLYNSSTNTLVASTTLAGGESGADVIFNFVQGSRPIITKGTIQTFELRANVLRLLCGLRSELRNVSAWGATSGSLISPDESPVGSWLEGGCPIPSITVLSPTAGENLSPGQQVKIQYSVSGFPQIVRVSIQLNKGAIYPDGPFYPILGNSGIPHGYDSATGSYAWTVPSTLAPGDDYSFLISSNYPSTEIGFNGYSSNFNIVPATTTHALTPLPIFPPVSTPISNSIVSSVEYAPSILYDSSTGGYYEWRDPIWKTYIKDEWTDAAAIIVLDLMRQDAQKYNEKIKKTLEFLISMKKSDSPLFYDYYKNGNKYEAYINPPTVGIPDDSQVYRSAWASLALLEGYKLFKNSDPEFAERLKNAAIDLQDLGQDSDGGWLGTYNANIKHKTTRDNALMLLHLLSMRENGFLADRTKIDKTANWLLSMQHSSNYGFRSAKELDVIYAAEYSDQNAMVAWALKKYDDAFSNIDYSVQLTNWYKTYVPLVLDKSQYGSSENKWSFRTDVGLADGNRYTYISALYALAFSGMGYSDEKKYVIDWIEDFRNTSTSGSLWDANGYGLGYINGVKTMSVNSESHPLIVLALLQTCCAGTAASAGAGNLNVVSGKLNYARDELASIAEAISRLAEQAKNLIAR